MGELCRLERKGEVCVLTLTGDGEHRMNPPLVDAILACIAPFLLPEDSQASSHQQQQQHHLPSALITTNEGKFFSNGLDLSYPSRADVSRKFGELLGAFLRLPMPTVAAVCGHAAAGGFIFALAHDHATMRRDRGFMYMSEIDIGILIPHGPMNLVRAKMTPRAFRDNVLSGIKHTADQAVAAGFVDSAHPDSASTLEAALSLARGLAARRWRPAHYLATRAAMYPTSFRTLPAPPLPSLSPSKL